MTVAALVYSVACVGMRRETLKIPETLLGNHFKFHQVMSNCSLLCN